MPSSACLAAPRYLLSFPTRRSSDLELCSRTGGVPAAVCGPVVLHLAADRYFSSRLVIWLRDHGTDRFSNARPHPRRRTTKRNRRTTGHHLVSRFYGRIYGVTYLPVFVSAEL